MIKDDWYRNRSWNGKIDSYFEDQFKRSRGAANKAEYLQVQGSILLDNPNGNIQEVGVSLLSRLFDDFASEYAGVIPAQEKLGDFYLKHKNYKQAEHYFRLVTNYCIHQNSRTGTSTMADLKLAEAILRTNQPLLLPEAYQLVINYPASLLKLNDTQFYYAELAAQVCDIMNKKNEAKEFAITAIALSKKARPLFARHKTDRAGKLSELQLRTLHEISIV